MNDCSDQVCYSPSVRQLMIVFAGALLFSLLLIHPVIFLNDEWITANQVAQFSHGSQILYNEGKYGTYENGTSYAYFESRHNSLPYTSYLPVCSTPLLWIIITAGDHFPYLIITFWVFIAVCLFLHFRKKLDDPCLPARNHLTAIVPGCIILFFWINLITYNPFSIIGKTDPSEVLAVTLFHALVYSLFAVTLFLIAHSLFSHQSEAVLGFITLISCSSALFWTSTLKDHLDVLFLEALLVYCIISHIRKGDPWYGVASFLISGLLLWIRPEFGAFIIISLIISYYPIMILYHTPFRRSEQCLLFISPVFSIFGAIPLFLNNYLVTGDALKFPWQTAVSVQGTLNGTVPSLVSSPVPGSPAVGTDAVQQIISMFLHRLVLDGNCFPGLVSIFFSPESLKIPVLGLIPVFLLGILLIPVLFAYERTRFSRDEKQVIMIMACMAVLTIAAYLSSISGLGISIGIYPDVRYLSPVYLPLTIIGLIILLKFDLPQRTIMNISRNTGIVAGTGICLLLVLLSFLYPAFGYSDFFLWLNIITTLLVFITAGITVILFTLSEMKIIAGEWRAIPLPVLIALPLVWQIGQLILLNFTGGHLEQYPPLLPAVRSLFEYLSGTGI